MLFSIFFQKKAKKNFFLLTSGICVSFMSHSKFVIFIMFEFDDGDVLMFYSIWKIPSKTKHTKTNQKKDHNKQKFVESTHGKPEKKLFGNKKKRNFVCLYRWNWNETKNQIMRIEWIFVQLSEYICSFRIRFSNRMILVFFVLVGFFWFL